MMRLAVTGATQPCERAASYPNQPNARSTSFKEGDRYQMIQYSGFSKALFFAFALMLAALPAQAQLLSVTQNKIKKSSDAGTEQLRRKEVEEQEKPGKRKGVSGNGVSESIQREALIKPAPGLIFENIRVTKLDPSKPNGNGMSKVPFNVMWKANIPRDIVVKSLVIELGLWTTDGSTMNRREVIREASQQNAMFNIMMRPGVMARKWMAKITVEYVYAGKGHQQRQSKMFTGEGVFDGPTPR
jgi:hypothetical protein